MLKASANLLCRDGTDVIESLERRGTPEIYLLAIKSTLADFAGHLCAEASRITGTKDR